MKFRLTIGENGTAMGKQIVIHEANAENAFLFALDYFRKAVKVLTPDEADSLYKSSWIDAGSNTLPIATQNLCFHPRDLVI